MKRFFLILFSFCCFSSLKAQNSFKDILKTYFRTNPFDMKFSSYIGSLQKDPWFTVEEYSRRTDTSFFFMTGTYKNFNPFHYSLKELRLSIMEDQFKHVDSLKTLDTSITIQLLGIADTSLSQKDNVVKEFKRFFKKYAFGFWKYANNYNDNGSGRTAELYNFFVYPYTISPISVAWGRIPVSNNYAFTITIRCKVTENIADLILTPTEH